MLLECSREQGCRLGGRFLSMDPPDTVDDVVCDVLGELANMIGGNLKCVLAQGVPSTRGIRISMPSVVDGRDYSVHVCGAEARQRFGFLCDEGPFWITLLSTRPPCGGSS